LVWNVLCILTQLLTGYEDMKALWI